jgi:hypothetical protein
MTYKMRFTFLLGLFFLISFSSIGQVQIGFGGIYTKRMGEFKNSSYKDGYGAMFSLYTGSVLPKSYPFKLRLGFVVNGSNAGSEKFEVETIEPANNTAKIRYKNNNNAMYWGVRLEKKVRNFAFYGDLLYGERKLYSIRKLQLLDDPDENYEDESDNVTESNRVFFGLGGGVSYYLTKNTMLDFNLNYTISKSFTYLDLATLKQDGNQICYEYRTAKSSDVLTFNVGVKFNLVGLGASLNSNGSGSSTSGSSINNSNSGSTTRPRKSPVKKKRKKKIKVKTNPGSGGSGSHNS